MQAIVAANRTSRTYFSNTLTIPLALYCSPYALRPQRRPTALGGGLVLVEADNAAVGDDCGHQLGGSDVERGVGRGHAVGGHPATATTSEAPLSLLSILLPSGVAASTVDSGAPTMKGIPS